MTSKLAQHNKALADRLSFFLRITVDKHTKIIVTNIHVNRACSYQCSFNTYIGWLLVHRLLVDRYPQILIAYSLLIAPCLP